MRWPWDKKQQDAQTANEAVTDPAREEIERSQDRILRINRILKEARDAQKLVIKTNTRR